MTVNSNTGHGHVFPRPDGVKARCGGPSLCSECVRDYARYAREKDASFEAGRVNAPSGTTSEPVATEPQGSAGESPAPTPLTSKNDICAQLREQAPLVDRMYADQLMRDAAKEIERLTRELAVQKGVNDLAYIPHRALVESRDALQTRYDKVGAERDRLWAAAEAVLAHFMSTFSDSRAVDDCLVQLAAVLSGDGPAPETPPAPVSKKEIPTFSGRLYVDDLTRGGLLGNWVRRAEADSLLDEIERLKCENRVLRGWAAEGPDADALIDARLRAELSGEPTSAPETAPAAASNEETNRDKVLRGEPVPVTDSRLAEMQEQAIAAEGIGLMGPLHWHWASAINELIAARAEIERLTRERDALKFESGEAETHIEQLTRGMNGQADVMVAREREFAAALLRIEELELANTGLATESERRRAALEGVRRARLDTVCGIDPLRAAGMRYAFEITREIADKALSGEPRSPSETSDEPPVMGGTPAPMPSAVDAINAHVREIEIICDAAGLDPNEFLSERTCL